VRILGAVGAHDALSWDHELSGRFVFVVFFAQERYKKIGLVSVAVLEKWKNLHHVKVLCIFDARGCPPQGNEV